MTAAVVDLGYMMIEKQKLGDAADAAALAGIQDLINDPVQAENIAKSYAEENGIQNPEIIIDPIHHKLTVNGQKNVPFFFAKALGYAQTTVYASATAQTKPISGGSGFVPLAVVQQSFEYGELYSLKYSPLDQTQGNLGALALGGEGASNYEDNLINGYQGTLTIGMMVPTEPGNMSGPTKKGIQDRMSLDNGVCSCYQYETATRKCHRVMYLPVIDSLDVNGRSGVVILGFAAFYLEGVTGNGNESTVQGRFLKMVYPGDWEDSNQNQFGLYAAKLVQ